MTTRCRPQDSARTKPDDGPTTGSRRLTRGHREQLAESSLRTAAESSIRSAELRSSGSRRAAALRVNVRGGEAASEPVEVVVKRPGGSVLTRASKRRGTRGRKDSDCTSEELDGEPAASGDGHHTS